MSPIAREKVSRVIGQVGLDEAGVISEDRSGHAGPIAFDAQRPVDVVAGDFLALVKEEQNISFPTKTLMEEQKDNFLQKLHCRCNR